MGKRFISSQFTLPSALLLVDNWININNWTRRYLKKRILQNHEKHLNRILFHYENWFFSLELGNKQTKIKRECAKSEETPFVCPVCLVRQSPWYGIDIIDTAKNANPSNNDWVPLNWTETFADNSDLAVHFYIPN